LTLSTTIALKDSILFERKLETVTEGLTREYRNLFNILSKEDALTLMDYVISLKTEINPSDNYRKSVIKIIGKFMMFCRHSTDVPLVQLGRENVLAFLGSFRKSEDSDPLHKWIGTYNLYRVHLLRFFKWLHHPDIEPNKRPRIIENIPQLKRKEKSIYKPTDMWTAQDDLLLLKYCLSKRMKCFHTMAKDTSCRPHELLKLRIKDVTFKIAPDKSQYAEATVNGKTGNRHLVLIDSIPYVKDYLDHEHPQPGNPNAIFLSGNRKSLGRTIGIKAIETMYKRYRTRFFPRLLESPTVLPEDKPRIRELLKKPWNPYIQRHSSLTDKSKILKEHLLRQHAGWSIGSDMPQKYLHYFGNESSESLLEAYGIMPKDQNIDQLKPKQCPNCMEPNKPESRFCGKCRMVLTYDAYSETVEEKQQKESEVKELKEKYEQEMKSMREEMENKFQQILAKIDTAKLT
jgi:integrase/recombinase XerD